MQIGLGIGATFRRKWVPPLTEQIRSLLFNAGQQGALYDPSDLSTLFQDAAGTTPVTAMEQPVGLILDKSQGLVLGPELVTGGGFDDPANWTSSTWTVSAGVATYPDTINDFIRPANANLLPLVAGKFYRVRFTLSGVTGSAVCAVANADGSVAYTALTTFTTDGEKQFIIYAATSTTNIRFYGYTSSGGTWNLNDLSIKELPGNHASQSTTTKRGVVSRRVNTFTRSEFQDGVIGGAGLVSIASLAGYAGSVAFGHDGVLTSYAYKSATPFIGFSAVLSVVIQMTDGGVPVTNSASAAADFMLVINGGQSLGATVVPLGGGLYRIISQPTVITASNTGVVKYNTNSNRTFKVTAYDLRLSIDAHLPYQSVNTAADYDADPNKFPTYIRFDGADDAYQTNSIDFTGTDKMTVWAGVANIIGSGNQAIIELSNSPAIPTSGSFWITANGLVTNDLWCALASPGPTRTGYSFPRAGGVLNVSYDFSGTGRATEIFPRLNGAVPVLTGGLENNNAGNGPFGNSPLYIGARAGTSLFFNGRLYQLIVRGAQSSLSQLEAGELLTRSRMKLP